MDYALLDAGNGERLETFGGVIVRRPCPAATFPRAGQPALWESAALVFADDGWRGAEALPASWTLALDNHSGAPRLELRPSPQGQVGVFPEQHPNWRRLGDAIRAARRPLRVLNLFGYTGAATLTAAAAGSSEHPAEVCHVDASKSAVAWARRNAELSGLSDRPIRWIVDDAMKFVGREARRGSRYDVVVLDPPAFGRGAGGATWKLGRDLPGLLAAIGEILTPSPLLVLLSAHDPALPAETLAVGLEKTISRRNGLVERGALSIARASGSGVLPLGDFAVWRTI